MIEALSRGVYLVAAMALFGDALFGVLLRTKLPVIPPLNNQALRWTVLCAAIVAGCLWFTLAAARMAGALNAHLFVESLTQTMFGRIFMLRLIALVALAFLFFIRGNRKLETVMTILVVALPSVTSHTALASPPGFIAVGAIVDATHLLTAGFWIGGLLVLAALFRRRDPNILLALSLFSEWAMVAVLILVMTGMINAASVLLSSKGTPSSVYLSILGAKLVLVAVMVWLAASNRFRWLPKGEHSRIERNIMHEISIGIIVVLLAGVLGQLQPLR